MEVVINWLSRFPTDDLYVELLLVDFREILNLEEGLAELEREDASLRDFEDLHTEFHI